MSACTPSASALALSDAGGQPLGDSTLGSSRQLRGTGRRALRPLRWFVSRVLVPVHGSGQRARGSGVARIRDAGTTPDRGSIARQSHGPLGKAFSALSTPSLGGGEVPVLPSRPPGRRRRP